MNVSQLIVPTVAVNQAPPTYTLVQGHTIVINGPLVTEVATMKQILCWIGFLIKVHRYNLFNNSIVRLLIYCCPPRKTFK